MGEEILTNLKNQVFFHGTSLTIILPSMLVPHQVRGCGGSPPLLEGFRALAIQIDDDSCPFRPGDCVDVIHDVVVTNDGLHGTTPRVILKDVQVLALGQQRRSSPLNDRPQTATLLVAKLDTPALYAAQLEGRLRIARR